MKSKRILLFALFTCVFALYGCVSSVSETAVMRPIKADMKENAVPMITTKHIFLPKAQKAMDHIALQEIMNGDSRNLFMIRDVNGTLSAKSAIQNAASDYKKLVKLKQQEIKQQKEIEKAEKRRQQALKKQKAIKQKQQNKMMSFQARITTYGVDCFGCNYNGGRGNTAMGIGIDMYDGVEQIDGSYMPGLKYGNYYVVAADPNIPLCSVLKISNHGLSGSGISPNDAFYAIVLDRGGAIYGGHLDLFIGSENSGAIIPIMDSRPNVEIVRMGGRQGGTCAL